MYLLPLIFTIIRAEDTISNVFINIHEFSNYQIIKLAYTCMTMGCKCYVYS